MSIELRNVHYTYGAGTPFQVPALEGINLTIGDGEFIGLIGHTGSGKSTLAQHLNALLKPTAGEVMVDGVSTTGKGVNLKSIRQKVGLVFQYPEHQLFEETVFKDVAFGPRNLGLQEAEVTERVQEALSLVGLSAEELGERSPFELSGGQKRRVALAGVLAMRPRVLVLDEPTAGLDPRGRDEVLSHLRKLHKKGMTVVLVTHNMDEVAQLAERLVVMHRGRIVMQGSPVEVFRRGEELRALGLGVPEITALMQELARMGKPVRPDILTLEEAEKELASLLGVQIEGARGKRNGHV